MIFVDPLFDTTPYTRPGTPRCFRNTLSCHMFSDLPGEEGTRELVAFAKRIGLKPEWIQHRGSFLEHYGQPARDQELSAARLWSRRNHIVLVELRAEIPAAAEVMHLGVGAAGARRIPCRNLVFLSLAAGIAARWAAPEIWYGATAADQGLYPDCRPEFAAALSSVLALETGASVHAPLSGMRRCEVVALAQALGVQRSECWSCYEPTPDGRPCGTCNSCLQDAELAGRAER